MLPSFRLISLLLVVLRLVAAEKDVCHGPLVRLSVDDIDSRSALYFGASAFFGRELALNETLSGALVIASPLDACSALSEPTAPGENFNSI